MSDFDVTSLQAFLAGQLPLATPLSGITRIPGGQSNPTYFLDCPDVRFVLRKKPAGVLLPSAHAIDREYRVQRALAASPVPVPRTRLYCEDRTIIGTEFYVMDCVPGRVFADCWMPGVTPELRRRMVLAMAEALAALHNVDYREVGLSDFGRTGDYYARQIARWSRQWEMSKSAPNPHVDQVIEWLTANVPRDVRTTINHGDFRVGNLIFDASTGRVAAVIDWELATLGDPLADVAYSALAWRLVSDEYMGMADKDLEALGMPTQQEYLDHYSKHAPASGRIAPFHFVFALFRLTGIFEGIAARARSGCEVSANAIEVGRLAGRFARRAVEILERG